ncbi:hypothetical protein ADEAN_000393600 [Angomonas deanei]|uniref:BspA type Leucine rich repeat region (6 copies) n=1 Tax=Angomonas deanei TaxID=59799 RepID=A0A7G2CC27_9TRYP|nr:hypothetical protein ADEAN_000393600 [Angomonas deanei]
MFLFRCISRYTAYFKSVIPLALTAVNSHARECGEHHEEGVLGCNIVSDTCGRSRIIEVDSSDVACLERVQWWIERERDCPLRIAVRFSGNEFQGHIPAWEKLSQRLSAGKVEHTFDLQNVGVESLLPFAVLLKRSGVVRLDECDLNTLEALAGLELLREVHLSSCHGAFTLVPLLTCPNLTSIGVTDCPRVSSPEVLGRLRNLKEISLADFSITSLDFLKDCTLLEYVNVRHCKNFLSLDGLSGIEKLKTVIACYSAIESIEHLAGCVALESVNVSGCRGLTSLEGLSGLEKLRTVNVSCTSIESIEHFAGCLELEKVNVSYCKNLTSLVGLSGLKKLKTLDASYTEIESVEHLSECEALESLDVSYCEPLASLSCLDGLPNLRSVKAIGTFVPPDTQLCHCPKVKYLVLK